VVADKAITVAPYWPRYTNGSKELHTEPNAAAEMAGEGKAEEQQRTYENRGVYGRTQQAVTETAQRTDGENLCSSV